jgi:transcriptional regulator with PAS, ATPase and Fis domain
MRDTIDDVSSVAGEAEQVTPVVVLVAVGTRPDVRVWDATKPVSLGRDKVDDDRMSKQHATVKFERGAWTITDRESRNGTFIDGERITGEVRAHGIVVVRCGHSVFLCVPDGRGYDGALEDTGDQVVGPELTRLYAQIKRHAQSPTLLVHGESGSGKELIARLYHAEGPRADGPFVAVNCAAIPEGVAERLLFGSRKGAFSGATDAVGYLQSAHGGTLFLDEIADLDPAVQAKLLRALETREVTPVGATTPIEVDVGVVAASHRELRSAVAAKSFREDLYYRLARAVVHLPPLRMRKLDIARLVVREIAAVDRKLAAHARLIETCCVRPWPGNVRELRAAVHQAAMAAHDGGRDTVRPEDLPEGAGKPLPDVTATAKESPKAAAAAAPASIDKATVLAALEGAGGVVSAAARTLGLHRTQLYRLMDKHGIARDESDDK